MGGLLSNTHPAPTNIINGIKGWNTRHIYNYYGSSDYTNFNYATVASGSSYSDNLFGVIKDYDTYKGGYEFPERYFLPGKNLRVKGMLYISSGANTDAELRIQAGIENTQNTYTTIGLIEGNTNKYHLFGDGATRSAYTEFELIYSGIETLSKPSTLVMGASGYFRYNNPTSRHSSNFLIPIVRVNSMPQINSDLKTNPQPITINLNFSGSYHINTINVLNLSIEELE